MININFHKIKLWIIWDFVKYISLYTVWQIETGDFPICNISQYFFDINKF